VTVAWAVVIVALVGYLALRPAAAYTN